MVKTEAKFLSMSLQPIRAAYEAGRTWLDKEFEEIACELATAQARSDAGAFDDAWVDEGAGRTLSNLEYQTMRTGMIEEALQVHRKAFILMIFHTWEKHVCLYMDYAVYPRAACFNALKAKGWTLDPKGLEILRMLTNCIKHDDAQLFNTDPSFFPGPLFLFSVEGIFSAESKGTRVNRERQWTAWGDELHGVTARK